jgi:hypothetical protein
MHYDKQYLIKALPLGHQYDIFYSCDNEPAELIDNLVQLYKPIAVNNKPVVYDIDLSKYPNIYNFYVQIGNMTRHFVNKKRVFHLFEEHVEKTNTKYDLVISARFDLCMNNINLIIPEKNTLYVPSNKNHYGINDQLAMGNSDTMKKYMNIYDTCVYLLENNLSVPHPESLNKANIMFHGINVCHFHMPSEILDINGNIR